MPGLLGGEDAEPGGRIAGKKGVFWWQIHRLNEQRRPPFLFLENVDRLLKSPVTRRGRDFAIMLASLSDLGYLVEWRVANAADYGSPRSAGEPTSWADSAPSMQTRSKSLRAVECLLEASQSRHCHSR